MGQRTVPAGGSPRRRRSPSLGAAILAGIGVGLYPDEEEALQRVYRPGRTFEPNDELARQYAEGFEVYRELYPALKTVHYRLK